jgi:phage tail protein X
MQTATVPIAPLTENRTELSTDLQTTRRLGSLSAEDMPAPVKHMRLQGTLPISPILAPSETVPSQVPLPTPRVIVVQAGDTLGEIILRTYKRLDNQLLTMVREANPGITNPSHIEVGQRIVVPTVQ